ncbi:MAG: GAF domain-containing protein [Anaerolineaceae bacterium]|nr:GAF domain-containing protein [Anaerolineaceae bacterium]
METGIHENSVLNSAGDQVQAQNREGIFFPNLRLQTRLTLILLIIVVPILLLINILLTNRAESNIRNNVNEQLKLKNDLLLSNMRLWEESNENILNQLASLNDITAMQPEQQSLVLEKTGKAFPSLYLIHTIGVSGMNIARSDGNANVDYSDREYFKSALAGASISFQVLIGRTSKQPALAMSVPIRDSSGKIIGVVAGVSELSVISNAIAKTQSNGNLTQAYIVDAKNQVVAHTDPKVSAQLTDFTQYPPVSALRSGSQGSYLFVDNQGRRWLAFLSKMDNGWGIVTQVDVAAALAPVYQFRQVSWIITIIGIVLLALLSSLFINRSLRPIGELTATARAIAAGDLGREVEITRNDEVGDLANAFRSMTQQLRESIETLEKGVAERTRVVEVTAEVSRRLSMILDQAQLIREVVDQLQKAFNYYHVHIYLFDETRENLAMVGGSGEPGKIMLARGHKIPRGKGLVGRAAQTNEPVAVRNTLQDPGWLPNALLPDTKSEIAVPISVGGEVLGVLDVQQDVPGGFSRADAELIQSIANQVAIAIQNARAFGLAQQRAEQETLALEISQKIQHAATVDDVLKVAVSELGRVLGAKNAVVELSANHLLQKGKS